jgi:hypothetical protein
VIEDSATFWLPKIKDLEGINVPETVMIEFTDDMAVTIIANVDLFIQEYGPVFNEALSRFSFPVFVRTDEISRKHDWINTCYVEKKEDFYHHVQSLVSDSKILGEKCRAILIRKFLKLESSFEYFNGMPVSKERRYFIDGGEVRCHHAYWNEVAFDSLTREMKEKLDVINHEDDDEIATLTAMASRVASVLDGAFSLDFALDVYGTWWLIDCATSRNSYHPPCNYKNGES